MGIHSILSSIPMHGDGIRQGGEENSIERALYLRSVGTSMNTGLFRECEKQLVRACSASESTKESKPQPPISSPSQPYLCPRSFWKFYLIGCSQGWCITFRERGIRRLRRITVLRGTMSCRCRRIPKRTSAAACISSRPAMWWSSLYKTPAL